MVASVEGRVHVELGEERIALEGEKTSAGQVATSYSSEDLKADEPVEDMVLAAVPDVGCPSYDPGAEARQAPYSARSQALEEA